MTVASEALPELQPLAKHIGINLVSIPNHIAIHDGGRNMTLESMPLEWRPAALV